MNKLIDYYGGLISKAITEAGYDVPAGAELVRASDRPDLSDFQSNIAMAIAKTLRRNPAEVALAIATAIGAESVGGFVNIKVSSALVSELVGGIVGDDRLGVPLVSVPKNIIVDYGGPNVAKALHVGHLRSSVIGETLKRMARFAGHNVKGDIHIGDWGLPMGMIISYIKENEVKLPLTVEDLNKIYPQASARSKTDEDFMARAQEETKKLQNGDVADREIWQSFVGTSVADIKKLLALLNVEFDLWLGESDANDTVNRLALELKKYSQMSEGAEVIFLDKYPFNNSETPPFIVVKSNGAVMYGMTDVATLANRKAAGFNEVWYVVDKRQDLHFHQVFAVSEMAGIMPRTALHHLGFGSVLGEDGKPLKTRSGDNVPLETLIFSAIEAAGGDADVAIAAIKFADLVNPYESDYVFNMGKFLAHEGKTGPYVLYTAVRIKSMLAKADLAGGAVVLQNDYDKKLAMALLGFADSFERALAARAPHIFVQYIYELCVVFNSFYHNCNILAESSQEVRESWIILSKMTLIAIENFSDIIGIKIPNKM